MKLTFFISLAVDATTILQSSHFLQMVIMITPFALCYTVFRRAFNHIFAFDSHTLFCSRKRRYYYLILQVRTVKRRRDLLGAIQLANSWAWTQTQKFWLQEYTCSSCYRRYTPLDLISNIYGHLLIYKIVKSDFYFHNKYKRVAKWILRVTEMY